ncbi:MAG: PPC domain-containing protein [Archangium sp.]|nr:PPC domain-containing protein [Archangium sp.]
MSGPMRVTALLGLLLVTAGCPVKPPITVPDGGGVIGGVTSPCTTRSDCASGLVCTNAFCQSCSSSGQCTVKETCDVDTRRCALREGWGSACALNEDCSAGSWCKQGLCLDRSEVSLCPSGLKTECPQGERCNTVTTVCEEDVGCSTNDDCSGGEVCNTGSRACVPRCTVDTQATVCAGGERCVSERCVQCSQATDCAAGLVCDAAGRCTAGNRCYSDRDCSVPLVCFIQTGACLAKPPPCISNDNCGADERCEVNSGRCVPRACQPDRYEPNNDDTKAFAVAPGSFTGLTLCTADVDWYSVRLSRGDQLGVNLDADPFSENAFSTVIKDTSGRTLAAGRLLVSYVAPATATYFVVISSTDAFQKYDVTFLQSRGTPCDDDANEPNDLAAQATGLNTATNLDGSICPQDADWFRAVVPAAKGLRVSLQNYLSSAGLLRLCIFTADGASQLACTDDLDPVLTLPSSTAAGRPLAIRVDGSADRIANQYTLNVEFP